jgi:Xaa-Pro aminopeptidase
MSQNKQNRILRLIEKGRKYDLDWILCMLPENIFYFSGFRTMFYTRFIGVLTPLKDGLKPVLITSFIDRRLVEDKIWSPHWFEEVVYWGPGADYKFKNPFEALKAYLNPGIRLGTDGISYDFYQELIKAFEGIEVISLQNEISEIRVTKSEEEIALIKKAFALSEEVMSIVPDLLQEPMTEIELAGELNYAGLKAGAEGNFYPTLVSSGPKMLALHSPPLSRPIKENELIRVAFALQIDGYGSDIVRHFYKGKPPAELVSFKNAYFEAQQAVFESLKPGVRSIDLIGTVEKIYKGKGVIKNWGYSVGHGLALTIHEPPKIVRDDQTIISENMVLAIEPILVCPPYGAITHCDGVQITEHGAEWLSKSMRDLVVI